VNRILSCVGWNRRTCQQRLWPRLAREPAKGGLLRCRQICTIARYFGVLKGVSPEVRTPWRSEVNSNCRYRFLNCQTTASC
jgi:hypothetical protein